MKIAHLSMIPLAAGLFLTITLGGCGPGLGLDYGTWHPSSSNAMNLQLQVVHPTDLAQGRGEDWSDGDTAAQAIDRARHDKTKPLPAVDTKSGGGS